MNVRNAIYEVLWCACNGTTMVHAISVHQKFGLANLPPGWWGSIGTIPDQTQGVPRGLHRRIPKDLRCMCNENITVHAILIGSRVGLATRLPPDIAAQHWQDSRSDAKAVPARMRL